MGSSQRLTLAGLTFALTLPLLTGCPQVAVDEFSNQGGGNLVTATSKIVGGRLGELTPDEVQILGDRVTQVAPLVEAEVIEAGEISDDEAEAAVDFLVVNDINTVSDLRDTIELAGENPEAVVIPQSLANLVIAGAFDGE